jgi:transporter family protein
LTLAIVFALLAAVGWGTGAVFARLGLQHMRSTTGTVVSLAAGVVMVGSLALAVNRDIMFTLPVVALLWFLLLGTINYPLGRYFNFLGVHLAGVSRASPILAAAPVVAVILGITLGGESLTPFIGLGTVLIIGGVVLIVTERMA